MVVGGGAPASFSNFGATKFVPGLYAATTFHWLEHTGAGPARNAGCLVAGSVAPNIAPILLVLRIVSDRRIVHKN